MVVDTLLRYYGINPEAYPEVGDRWMVVSIEAFLSGYYFIPIIFALLPWAYFFWKKGRHIKDRRKFIKNTIIASLAGLALGLMTPYIILAITAGLAAKSIYGG